MSVYPSARNNPALTEGIFMKFDICVFLEILSRKLKFLSNQTRITVTLHEDQNIFFNKSRSFLLRMRTVSGKSCRENQNTPYTFNNLFLISYRLLENVEKYVRARQATDDNIICSTRNGCWITKVTNTHLEYVSVTMAIRARFTVTLHLGCLYC